MTVGARTLVLHAFTASCTRQTSRRSLCTKSTPSILTWVACYICVCTLSKQCALVNISIHTFCFSALLFSLLQNDPVVFLFTLKYFGRAFGMDFQQLNGTSLTFEDFLKIHINGSGNRINGSVDVNSANATETRRSKTGQKGKQFHIFSKLLGVNM